jgi:hypothetical protein
MELVSWTDKVQVTCFTPAAVPYRPSDAAHLQDFMVKKLPLQILGVILKHKNLQ